MNRPKTRRNRTKLYALHAALFDKGDGVLKVIVSVLGAIGSEVSSRRHRSAVNCFDYSEFVSGDLDQRHFAHDLFEGPSKQVKARLQDVGLNPNFAFGSDNTSCRHLGAAVAPFLNRYFAGPDIDHHLAEKYQHNNKQNRTDHQNWNDRRKVCIHVFEILQIEREARRYVRGVSAATGCGFKSIAWRNRRSRVSRQNR